MTPEPWVRLQAASFAILLLVATAFGQPLAALITVCVVTLVVWALRLTYRRGLTRHDASVPWDRDRLDLIVSADVRAAVSVGFVAAAMGLAFELQAPDVGVAGKGIVPLIVIAAVVYASSLVDWFVVLPRISGQLGPRPCRDRAARFLVFPSTWKETTRVWLLHRAIAAFVVRFGLGLMITLLVSEALGLRLERIIVGTALLGGFASYVKAIPFASFGRPKLVVGQTIYAPKFAPKRVTVPLIGVRLPIPLSYERVDDPGWRKYVYDVSLEGFQLVGVEPFERPDAGLRESFQGDTGDVVPLPKAAAGHPENDAELQFSGCRDRCSKISWYCAENPDRFKSK